MRLFVVEAGRPPECLRPDWDDYPAMFKALLCPHKPDLEVDVLPLQAGAPLPDPKGLDSILITGSASGVGDDMPWIGELLDFIRAAASAGVPQAGVCFGHQAMAKAFGARVERSPKGWGLGRQVYTICHTPAWMRPPPPASFALGVSHQDQVLSLPDGAVLFAENAFTPFGGLDYPAIKAFSIQGHPEFSRDFFRALYDTRRDRPLSPSQIDAADFSLKDPVDNDLVGGWLMRVLEQNCRYSN